VLAICARIGENYIAVVFDRERMTLGLAERQGDLLDDVNRFCDETLAENSIYAVLHRERDRLFPDEMFADLFSDRGRRSVPPSVVATVMVLQRLEGLSDREAVERYTFDARWRYAAGVGGYDTGGWGGFAHTVQSKTMPQLVNQAVEQDRRPVPFRNMIYIGDGLTDIPCFSLVGNNHGTTFGVWDPARMDRARIGFREFLQSGRVMGPSPPALPRRRRAWLHDPHGRRCEHRTDRSRAESRSVPKPHTHGTRLHSSYGNRRRRRMAVTGPLPTLPGLGDSWRKIDLYIDESYTEKRWLYIGVLVVPEDHRTELSQQLVSDRSEGGYDGEIHLQRVTSRAKRSVAERWLARLVAAGRPPLRFHVLGIDRTKLRPLAFGQGGRRQMQAAYGRFLRTAVSYSVKALVKGNVVVHSIIHDARNLAGDEYFDWHAPWRLRRDDPSLRVAAEKIVFVDSDHRTSGRSADSTFIQLTDLAVGLTRLCLVATNHQEHQIELARQWLPLLHCLTSGTDRVRHQDCASGHLGRCSVSFFPRGRAEPNDSAANLGSSFYTSRIPALADVLSGQGRLQL
jgi:hypothetical protein